MTILASMLEDGIERTESAIASHSTRLSTVSDPYLIAVMQRSLASLGETLVLQRRTLAMLLDRTDATALRPDRAA